MGRVVFGMVADRVGIDRLLRCCLLCAVAGAVLFTVPLPAWAAFAGLVLVGFGLAPVFPCLMTRTPQRLGRELSAHAVGFQVGAAMIGAAAVPAALGLLAGAATGVGSLPHRDARAAAEFSLRENELVMIPSLPRRSPAESLIAQAVVGTPGVTLGQYGAIAVDREASAAMLRRMMKEGRALAAEGRSLLLFPEGTRVRPGEAPPLKSGFAGLYKVLGLPVVPIAVDSGRLWPKRGAKRAGVITYRFGEPVPPGLPRDEAEARALALPKIQSQLGGSPPRKVIVVPDRLVNIVA